MDRQPSALGDLQTGAADNLRWSFTATLVAVAMHDRRQTSTPELELSSFHDRTPLRRAAFVPFSPSTPSVRARALLTGLYELRRDGCASPCATLGPAELCADSPRCKSPRNRLCSAALLARTGRRPYDDGNFDGVCDVRLGLFDPALEYYFWQWNTQGRAHAQLVFVPNDTP